jgi:hypothetical protein
MALIVDALHLWPKNCNKVQPVLSLFKPMLKNKKLDIMD